MKDKYTRAGFRKVRTRRRLLEAAAGGTARPRLTVHRSSKYLYAQVIDDASGRTLAAASSLGKAPKEKLKSTKNVGAAAYVGELIAKKAIEAGVKKVAFDRGSYQYGGRVKALADAARAGGLEF